MAAYSKKKKLTIAAIGLTALLAIALAGAVTWINAGLSRRLAGHLPALAVKIPGVSFYDQKAARYNILTDSLIIDQLDLKLGGRAVKIYVESLKVRGLRTYILEEAGWTEGRLPVVKSLRLEGLRLETDSFSRAALSCRKLEAKKLKLPWAGLKRFQSGDFNLQLDFAKLAADDFKARLGINSSRNLLTLQFNHLRLAEKGQARLGLAQVIGLELTSVSTRGVRSLELGALAARNLDFSPLLGLETKPGPWPWPMGLDLLEIKKASLRGFSNAPLSVSRLTFKGLLEPGFWPEQASLEVDKATFLKGFALFRVAEPHLSFKARLTRERELGQEVSRLAVKTGQFKKWLEWTADIKIVMINDDGLTAEDGSEPGLAWARLEVRENGLGRWMATLPSGPPAAWLDKLKGSFYTRVWNRGLRNLENPQELKRLWEAFARPDSEERLLVTANPERPWPLKPKARKLWRPGQSTNELGLQVRLLDRPEESWPVRFKN